jgi:hypothetical protein
LGGQANATHPPTHTRRDGNLRARACPDPWAPAATPIDARVPELARNATLCRSHLACKETRLAAQYACFSWVHQPTLASLVRASLPRACAVGSMRKAQGLSPLAVVGAVRWKTGAEDSHPRVCGPGFALHMPLRWPPRQSDGARRRGLTSLQRCRWRRIQIRAAASYYNASPKNMRRGLPFLPSPMCASGWGRSDELRIDNQRRARHQLAELGLALSFNSSLPSSRAECHAALLLIYHSWIGSSAVVATLYCFHGGELRGGSIESPRDRRFGGVRVERVSTFCSLQQAPN